MLNSSVYQVGDLLRITQSLSLFYCPFGKNFCSYDPLTQASTCSYPWYHTCCTQLGDCSAWTTFSKFTFSCVPIWHNTSFKYPLNRAASVGAFNTWCRYGSRWSYTRIKQDNQTETCVWASSPTFNTVLIVAAFCFFWVVIPVMWMGYVQKSVVGHHAKGP